VLACVGGERSQLRTLLRRTVQTTLQPNVPLS
jgi:hypothetical protein